MVFDSIILLYKINKGFAKETEHNFKNIEGIKE